MRIFVLLLGLALGVNAYGGYGSKSPAFKTRADFEPKEQTLSPVLPPGESPYNTPPPIPMPDKSSSSSEEKPKGCGDVIHTTTAAPVGCGSSGVNEHVHVDNESGAPLQKVLPPQIGYGEVEKPVEQEVRPAATSSEYGATVPAPQSPSQSAQVSEYGGGASAVQPAQTSSSHFSSATKEEVDLYGIEVPTGSATQDSTPSAPTTVTTTASTTQSTTAASSAAPTASPYEQPQPPALPSSTASTGAPTEVAPAAASASPQPSVSGYEGGEDETPAQEIARIPDNNNLYEKIAEIPSTTVSTTAATVPYEQPAPQKTPYQPPAPRAQIPTSTAANSGYDIVNEVEAPQSEHTEEPYGQKVEAAHITEETAGSDYDQTHEQTSHSSSSSQTYSETKTSSSSNGYDQSSSNQKTQQIAAPSSQSYSQHQTSNLGPYQQVGAFKQAGYNAGGSSYAQTGGAGYSQPQSFLPPAPVSYVQQPQPSSYVQTSSYQATSYPQQQSNGCCGGNWFSSQGSLCAPVNYNPCPAQSYSSGCGQPFGGFGGFGSSGCGGCSSAPSCTPCAPVSSGCSSACAPACPPPCPPPTQNCCCPQPAANPFASLCGGRKKRSIQTLLGLCGRRRRL